MRIVHTEASCGWGGQEIRILSEAAGMIERGHEVLVLCPPDSNIFSEGPKRGVPTVALPIGRKNLHGVLAMRRWLQRHPVDVVNTHSSTDSWLGALACATLREPPPLVRTRHISAATSNNRATRWLYTSATAHIVTTGEALRRQLVESNGYPAENITSIPTGIDTEKFVPGDRVAARRLLGLDADAHTVAIVATLRSWKGHVYLLDALAKLPADTRLLIVGDGPYLPQIEKRLDELGLRKRVTMPGQQNDVIPWLRAADVFTLPSYANEGVPQAVLQAMMTGLPVVSTAVGAIAEAVEDGVSGILVKPRDPDDLARALASLLADPERSAAMGSAGRERALALFSRDSMLDRMEAVFRRVMA